MAGTKVLADAVAKLGIGLGSRIASAAHLLPGKSADPTLIDGYPGSRNYKSSIVPFHLQYDSDNELVLAWGHCSQSGTPVEESILLRTGRDGLYLKTDGEVMAILEEREGVYSAKPRSNYSPLMPMREFLVNLIAHVKKRGTVTFGDIDGAEYKVAMSVPPWWYGKVDASALGPFGQESETQLEVQLIPEPVSCLAYSFSRDKKHPLGDGGMLCHCNMDDQFTTMTRVLVSNEGSSLSASLQTVEIQNLSLVDISNAFRELLESRLEDNLSTIDDDATEWHSKLQEIDGDFIKFLSRFDGTKDYKLRLPWKLHDRPEVGIRNKQLTIEASVLRQRVFRKLLQPLGKSLARAPRGDSPKLWVLCSGVLSECPYVPLCLTQILSEDGAGEQIEVLKAVNGHTSPSRGSAIFLDINRRHSHIGSIQPLSKDSEVVLTETSSSRSHVLRQRFGEISNKTSELLAANAGDPSTRKKATVLEKMAKFTLHEYLERFGFADLLLPVFASLHSIHIILGKRDGSTETRELFDKTVREAHSPDQMAQAADLLLWACKVGADPDLLDFLRDTGSSLDDAASFGSRTRVYPVHVAVEHMQQSSLEWLVQNGASIYERTDDGSTCLHIAIRNLTQLSSPASKAMVEFLIPRFSGKRSSADSDKVDREEALNLENNAGLTALDLALETECEEIVEALIHVGAKQNSNIGIQRQNVIRSIEADDGLALLETISSSRATALDFRSPDGMKLIHLAVSGQSFNCVQVLLKHAMAARIANVNVQSSGGWSPLHLAVSTGNLAITTLLIQSGANIEASSDKGHGWIRNENDVLSFMTSKCPAGLRGGCWKPLHIAAAVGNEAILRILLENSAWPHSKDLEGYTALRRAIIHNHESVVRILVTGENQTQPAQTSTALQSATETNPSTFSQDNLELDQPLELDLYALHDAVKTRNVGIVNLLLQNGWDPNAILPESRWTPLSSAISLQNEPIVSLLLKQGADPTVVHSDGSIPLHLAAEGQKIQIVRALVPLCSTTAKDNNGATPLHYTARKGFSPTARVLLDNKVDVNALDSLNRTALYWAIEHANLPVAQFLFDCGANPAVMSNHGRTLLHAAAYSGDPRVLNLVLSRGNLKPLPLDFEDSEGNTPLGVAAKGGHGKVVQQLLQLHKPRNLWRPILNVLSAMAATGNLVMSNILLDHDQGFMFTIGGDLGTAAIVDINGMTTISKSSWSVAQVAAWEGHWLIVQCLLERGLSVNAKSTYSLTLLGLVAIIPCRTFGPNHLRVAELLIERGADLSSGGFGNTPLHLATIAGHEDLVSLLLCKGAPVAAVNLQGESALCCAVVHGHITIIAKLIEYGADANQLHKDLPLLHEAVYNDKLNVVKALIASGADINAVATNAKSALLTASMLGRASIVRHLLDNGAELDARTPSEGHSALDLAVIGRHVESVREILNSAAYAYKYHSDPTYAWAALSKKANSNWTICKYIYEKTNCQRDLGAGILHWAIAKDCVSLVNYLVDTHQVDLKIPNSDGWSALHAAVMKGSLAVAQAILDRGFEVDHRGHKLRTALHQAVAANQPQAVSFLLFKGASPTAVDEDGQDPLHIAIDYAATDALHALPLGPDDFTRDDFNGKSLVGLAAESENSILLRALLAIEQKLGAGHKSSLQRAVSVGDTHLTQRLLGHGAELNLKDAQGHSPLREAVEKRNLEAAAMLAGSGADLETKCNQGITPLHSAALFNDVKMFELLISHSANLNSVGGSDQDSILIDATRNGHVDIVDLLIKAGCDVQCKTSGGNTALHIAAVGGHIEVAKRLVQGGLPVDAGGENGQSPLYFATRSAATIHVIAALIELGADVNHKQSHGYAPLHVAAELDQCPTVDLLLKHGAEINCVDATGRTPVMLAARVGAKAAFFMLAERGAELGIVCDLGESVIHYAAYGNSVEIGKLLVTKGFDVNTEQVSKRSTPLITAAGNGCLEFVQYLEDQGADMEAASDSGETALIVACYGTEPKHVEVVKFLLVLGHGCDQMKKTGHTPIMLAAEVGNLAMVTLLVEHGARLDIKTGTGWGPIHAAVYSGKVEILDYLLQYGLDLNDARAGIDRNTLLHIAVGQGREVMAEALCKRLPSLLPLTNKNGLTALQMAVVLQNFGTIQKLCDMGADVHAEHPGTGKSLLHFVAESSDTTQTLEIVGYLVEKGLSVDAVAKEGNTPIESAVIRGAVAAAEAFLAHGADIERFGKSGRPIDMAIDKGMADMVNLLLSKGASITHLNLSGDHLLYRAVFSGSLGVVKTLLQHGGSDTINLLSNGRWTALHYAVTINRVDMINLLLEHGAGANVPGEGRSTPLQVAATKGNVAAAEVLFAGREPIDVDFTNSLGDTAMVIAAKVGATDFIRCLMKHRRHLAVPSSQWDIAVSSAAENNHFETVEFFFNGAK